jgi:hypothetical protein
VWEKDLTLLILYGLDYFQWAGRRYVAFYKKADDVCAVFAGNFLAQYYVQISDIFFFYPFLELDGAINPIMIGYSNGLQT